MANPFLVLGGIAIGIITAGFGVLAVPGWVESAQDAAAINDVANAALAQSASVSETGRAIAGRAALLNGEKVKVTESMGATLSTYANGANWAVVSKSASGKYFAKVSSGNGVQTFQGDTIDGLRNAPGFAAAWNAGGFGPVQEIGGDGATSPGDSAVVQMQMSAYDGRTFTVVAYTPDGRHSSVTIERVAPGETGTFSYTVNGRKSDDVYLQPSQLEAHIAATGLVNAWAAAGHGVLDLSNIAGSAAAAHAITYDPVTGVGGSSPADRAYEMNQWAGYAPMFASWVTPDMDISQEGVTVEQAFAANAYGILGVNNAYGHAFGIVLVDGETRAFTADSRATLLSNAAFQAALASAGLSY